MRRETCSGRPSRLVPVTRSRCASPAARSMPPFTARIHQAKRKPSFFISAAGNFQNRQEGFLRNVHPANALHAFLSFFLLFKQLAFARDVAAVAFGEHVFANGADGLAGDDAAPDGGLY